MKYFHISNGLRGCYMPDNAYTIAVATRRELKAVIESEAESFRDAGYTGASKDAVASLAAEAWSSRSSFSAAIMSLAPPHCPREYSYGLFVAGATRAEYLESQEESF